MTAYGQVDPPSRPEITPLNGWKRHIFAKNHLQQSKMHQEAPLDVRSMPVTSDRLRNSFKQRYVIFTRLGG